jgi:hypothetical protein
VSIIICASLILAVYVQEYGQTYQAPPLLNGNFKYWTLVPGTNQTKPYLWETDFINDSDDLLWITHDTIKGETALGMHVIRGLNDTADWAMLHVRQDLTGRSAAKVFQATIGVWVYPTFPYHPDPVNTNPRNAFGIEISDGIHLVWFIFSTGVPAVYELKLHRIVVIPTPLNQWSQRMVNIEPQYEDAKWPAPESFSFSLITGATKLDPGTYKGYFESVTVIEPAMLSIQFGAFPNETTLYALTLYWQTANWSESRIAALERFRMRR